MKGNGEELENEVEKEEKMVRKVKRVSEKGKREG